MDQLAKRNDGGLANETTTDYNKEYLHDLIITSSAFIGNLISAIAVYYFIRSFLLGKELWQRRRKREEREVDAVLVAGASHFLISTALFLFVGFLSVFLLYIIHTEAGVVVMLSVFKAIAAPGWSITSVLVADIFPTSLRYAYHCFQLNYLYQSFICCSCSDCYFYLFFVADLQLWVYFSSLLK